MERERELRSSAVARIKDVPDVDFGKTRMRMRMRIFFIVCFLYKSRFFANDFSSFFPSACLPIFFSPPKLEKK